MCFKTGDKVEGGWGDGPALDVAILTGGYGAWATSAPDGDEWTDRGDGAGLK